MVHLPRQSLLCSWIMHVDVSYVDDILGHIGSFLVYLDESIGTSALNMVAVVDVQNVRWFLV